MAIIGQSAQFERQAAKAGNDPDPPRRPTAPAGRALYRTDGREPPHGMRRTSRSSR
jgi:hypothetical protein